MKSPVAFVLSCSTSYNLEEGFFPRIFLFV